MLTCFNSFVFTLLTAYLVKGCRSIISGSDARIEDFPWMVSIRDSRLSYGHICGGALFRLDVVITAANCVNGRPVQALRIVAGTPDRRDGGQTGTVKKFTIHPNYNGKYRSNDIAILILTERFKWNFTLKEIPIAETNEVWSFNQPAWVSGWGQNGPNSNFTEKLQYLNTTTLSDLDCNRVFGSPTETVKCTREMNGMSGTCRGDTGNPLAIQSGRIKKLLGVMSFTVSDQCMRGQPTAYTKVFEYKSWIESTLNI